MKPLSTVDTGTAVWSRGDVVCRVKGTRELGFSWLADRRWKVDGADHQLAEEGKAHTFFLALRATQRAADRLGKYRVERS